MNDNLFLQAEKDNESKIRDKINTMASLYYNEIQKWYLIIFDSINQSDYEAVQQQLPLVFKNDYDTEITSLKQQLLPAHLTLERLKQFLSEHREFIFNNDYIEDIQHLFQNAFDNMKDYKSNLFTLLSQYADEDILGMDEYMDDYDKNDDDKNDDDKNDDDKNDDDKNDDDKNDDDKNDDDKNDDDKKDDKNEYIEATIGDTLVSWNTYNDPILSTLYSLLMVIFGLKHFQEVSEVSIVYK